MVVAGGAGADWLCEHTKPIRKDVLTFLPFQPYQRLSQVLGASDVLIALLDSDAGTFAVPSKVLSYLSAGRPLLLAAPRENHATVVVEQADAGIVISPDSANDFVDAARRLMESSELRARYAANARAFAEHSFNIVSIADLFIDVFSKVGYGEAQQSLSGIFPRSYPKTLYRDPLKTSGPVAR